jgi:V/A-type H+-transporting ATPase subunit F
MAGVEGCIVHTAGEVEAALKQAAADQEVGVVLISGKLMELCRAMIYEQKLSRSRPLIVEVADRHGEGTVSDSITRYVREAVGIKI